MNILAVDDDPISRKIIHNTLEQLGYTVTLACDGREAWERFQQTPFRCIVCDWQMPYMDGLALCQKIRQRANTDYTYFIMLTLYSDDEKYYLNAMSKGIDDFLPKPIQTKELAIRLNVAQRILSDTSRIKSLETMLTLCAYTKKVEIPDEGWLDIEQFLDQKLGLPISHGISPEYYEEHIRPQLEALKQQRT